MKPLSPSTITRALSEATDQQIASEAGKRNARKRKIKSGGHNGGRPKRLNSSAAETSLTETENDTGI